ncbi:MAG: branched-chain amino acid transport system ATP-binding protein [Alphaproteobacteria bacterium]|nr:branched-chain amino acid transport system ATP-binding protein [Alphaproteobacteria bacterium]
MLRVDKLTVAYGKVTALQELSLSLDAGEIVALVGANGAGKTTTLAAISGLLKPVSGDIKLFGESLLRWSVEDIVGMGIGHSPEGRRVFPGLTVDENLLTGASSWRKLGQSIDADREKVYTLFPRLKERRKQLAWSLSGGEQQMLAIGRALMGRPKLLLLDEPSLGLAPMIIDLLFDAVLAINKTGVAILLVEQNAALALEVSHRAYVIETGRVILEGPAQGLLQDARVQEAYLGG